MKYYSIEMVGDFVNEIVTSIPTFDIADSGRMVYLSTDGTLWYCTNIKWVKVSGGAGAAFDIDQTGIGIGNPIAKPVYFNSISSEWAFALANDIDTVGTHVIIAVDTDDRVVVAQSGVWSIPSHGLTNGVYYTSSTVAGNTTQVKPSIVNQIFTTLDSDRILITPYLPFNQNDMGGGGAEDSYSDLLRSSVFENCSFDDFSTLDRVLVYNGIYDGGYGHFTFTNGQYIESENLIDPLLSSTTISLMMPSMYYDGDGIIEITADGTNWRTVNNNEMENMVNNGSVLKMRFTSIGNSVLYDWGLLYKHDSNSLSSISLLNERRFIATAGQSIFSMVYTPERLSVFLNGAHLDETEYDDSSGTQLVLTTPAEVNDIVYVLTYNSFTMTDSEFLRLNDTPDSYTGHADEYLTVNSAGNAMEFRTFPNPIIETGSKMLFGQSAAPTGWTQDTSVNDRVIRLTSGTGGGTGGTWSLTGITTGGHTLTTAEMPSHRHTSYGSQNLCIGGCEAGQLPIYNINSSTGYTGSNQPHSHPLSSDNSWRPSYLDCIMCTKN